MYIKPRDFSHKMVQRTFVIISGAKTTPEFTLKDIPGSTKRLDITCHSISSALFLSHGIRENTVFYAVLLGEPSPPVTIKLDGSRLRKVHPDERNVAIFLKKALMACKGTEWVESTPGIFVRKGGMESLLPELPQNIYLLAEGGEGREKINTEEDLAFIFGDRFDPPEDILDMIKPHLKESISIGKTSYFASHCIVILHHFLDEAQS